jgi:hypothetical protein
MGCSYEAICRNCGHRFPANEGGGYGFQLLHCDACGRQETISTEEYGEVYRRYFEGVSVPDGEPPAEYYQWGREHRQDQPITDEGYPQILEGISMELDQIESIDLGGFSRDLLAEDSATPVQDQWVDEPRERIIITWAEYRQKVLEYRQEVEAIVGSCPCGGRFRFNAPVRCPKCRSTDFERGDGALDMWH